MDSTALGIPLDADREGEQPARHVAPEVAAGMAGALRQRRVAVDDRDRVLDLGLEALGHRGVVGVPASSRNSSSGIQTPWMKKSGCSGVRLVVGGERVVEVGAQDRVDADDPDAEVAHALEASGRSRPAWRRPRPAASRHGRAEVDAGPEERSDTKPSCRIAALRRDWPVDPRRELAAADGCRGAHCGPASSSSPSEQPADERERDRERRQAAPRLVIRRPARAAAAPRRDSRARAAACSPQSRGRGRGRSRRGSERTPSAAG